MLTDNIMIASANLIDQGTIVYPYGTGAAGFPLTNLQKPETWLFGIFSGPYKSQTKVDVRLDGSQVLNLLAVLKHNCGPLSMWKVSLADSQAGLDTPTYTSGWLPMHPPIAGTGTLDWGEFDWGGLSPLDQQGFFNKHSYHPLPDTKIASWIRYEIDDESDVFAREDSFVQLARLWASSAYQPSLNVSYGAEIKSVDKTGEMESDSLVSFFDKRVIRRREMNVTFDNLPEQEMMYHIFGPIFMKQGKKGELIVLKYPTNSETFAFETIYGSLIDTGSVSDSFWKRKSTDLNLKELV